MARLVFVHHATDLPHFYVPYIEGFLREHESVVLAPYMWDFGSGRRERGPSLLDYRDRIYLAVSAPSKDTPNAPVSMRVVGRRVQVWQLWGDKAVRQGFGVAVGRDYRRQARRRWPQARIINYEDTICECTANRERSDG